MYLLPPLTLVTIFLCLPWFSSTSLVDESYQNCSPYPYHCGDVVNVIYPFLAGNRSTACGYPQMKLFCEDNSPRIVIESVNYTVKRIRERDRVFTAINTEYLATNCPQPLTDTNIGNTSFEYGNESEAVNLLYNCSSPVREGTLAHEISCLGSGYGRRSYYLFERNESTLMELRNRSRCKTRVQIMVMKAGGDEMRRNDSRLGMC